MEERSAVAAFLRGKFYMYMSAFPPSPIMRDGDDEITDNPSGKKYRPD